MAAFCSPVPLKIFSTPTCNPNFTACASATFPPSPRKPEHKPTQFPPTQFPPTQTHPHPNPRLHRLLRSRPFLSYVTSLAACHFVRFTGLTFQRCPTTDLCPSGTPIEMRCYEEDVRYIVVNVPIGIAARALTQPSRSTGTKASQFTANLLHLSAAPAVCAVYERHGLTFDEVSLQQKQRSDAADELTTQFRAWSDPDNAMRLETDTFSINGSNMFEESLDDLLGM